VAQQKSDPKTLYHVMEADAVDPNFPNPPPPPPPWRPPVATELFTLWIMTVKADGITYEPGVNITVEAMIRSGTSTFTGTTDSVGLLYYPGPGSANSGYKDPTEDIVVVARKDGLELAKFATKQGPVGKLMMYSVKFVMAPPPMPPVIED